MVASSTQAANITWGGAQNISVDTDVSLNGTLVRAANMTPLGQTLDIDVSLNGVTFVRSPRNDATTNTLTLPNGDFIMAVDDGSAGSTRIGPGTFQGFGGGSAPFNTLSAAYQQLLSTACWNDGNCLNPDNTARYIVTLNNLTIGKAYQLQVWVNDFRASNLGQVNTSLLTTVSDGVSSVDLQHNVNDIQGGIGQYVIGTFTADATNQVVTLTGGNAPGVDTDTVSCVALLNAYQLRAITPASAPVITDVLLAGSDITLNGTNGPPNGAYQMLRSPDVAAPMDGDDWAGIGVKNFDANGNFNFTEGLPENEPVNFYRVLVIASGPVSAPDITSQPQDLALAVGHDATFEVVATGTVPLTYRWYFNTNTLLASGPSATLTIPDAQLTNSGKISVTVSNLVGVTNSTFATLTVTISTAPPRITAEPPSLNVGIGQTAIFSVGADGALPLSYQWYFNTNTVLADQTNTTLTLVDVQTNQAGKYSATVTNLYGTTNSVFANLTVSSSSSSGLVGWASVPALGLTTTTGGAAGPTVTVSNATDLATFATSANPYVIRVLGTITLSGSLSVNSHKTIIGVGTNSTIDGQIAVNNKSNVIIRYLTITNPRPVSNEDGIQLVNAGTHHVWIDHCTIFDTRDGALDQTHATDYVTVSWCKFYYTKDWGHNLVCLISSSDTDSGDYRITWHHNWWSTQCKQRQPNVKHGYSHIFNCYWDCTGNSYCTDVRLTSQLLSENNYYTTVNNPLVRVTSTTKIRTAGNIFNNCTGSQVVASDAVDAIPYSYTLDPAANVPALVKAGAGNTAQ